MASSRAHITYVDGSTESIPLRPLGLVAAERHFKGDMQNHPIEMMLWATWYLKGKPDGVFDVWLESVDDISEKGGPPVPLDEEPSPDTSPT